MKVLVAGATGYVGGRLVPRLVAEGHEVRCLARTPGKIAERPWADDVETVAGDVLVPESLRQALDGIEIAPATTDLSSADMELVSNERRSFRLRNALRATAGDDAARSCG